MCILLGNSKKMWPMYVDYSDEECRRVLRSLELEAYANVVSALRAQGSLTKERRKILQDLCSMFSISIERHRAEVRRAVNDEHLNTIAERLFGPNTATEWAIEGRRVVPLMARLPPQTIFTAVADSVANAQAAKNATLPLPSKTGVREIGNGIATMASRKRKDFPCEASALPHKMTAVDSQYFNNIASFENSSHFPETSPSPPASTSCENFSTPDSTSQISSSLSEQPTAKTTASIQTTTTTTSSATSSQVKPPPKQIMLKSSSSTTTTSSSFDHLNSTSLINKPVSHLPVTTASQDEQQTNIDAPKVTETKCSQRSSPSVTMKTPSILPTSVSSSSSSSTSTDRIPISSTSTSSMGNKFLTQIRCKNTGHGRQNLGLGLKLNSQSQISQKGLSSKASPNIKIKQDSTSSFFTKKLSQTVFSSSSTDSPSQHSLSSVTESTTVTKSPASTTPKLSGKSESSVVSSSQSNNKLTTVSKSFPKTSTPSSLTRSLFSTATKVGTKPINPVIFNVSSTSSTTIQTSTKTTTSVSNDGAKSSQLLPKSASVGITPSNIKLSASNSQTIQYRNDGGVMRSARIVNLSQPVGSRLPCAITPSAISALGLASNLTSSGLRVTLPAGTLNTSASMRVSAAAKPNVIVVHKAQMWPRTQQGAAVIMSSTAPLPKVSSDSSESSSQKQEKSKLSGTKLPSKPIVPVPATTSTSTVTASTLKIPEASLMANPFASKSTHSDSSTASESGGSKTQESSENQCKKNLLADVIEASGILENCPDKLPATGKSSNKQVQETKEDVVHTSLVETGAKIFRRTNSANSVFDISSLSPEISISRSEIGKTSSETESVAATTTEKNEAVPKLRDHSTEAKEVSESFVSSSQINESLSSSAESSSSVQTEITEEKSS